ncbi:MAG: DUF1636 domain-containing protein [Pseudomonadota bacterium]
MAQGSPQVELLVCTKCRQGQEIPEDAERPGAALFRRLSEAAIDGVSVMPVECLSNCKQGCTVALRGPGRWTYVYGRFEPARDAAIVAEGAAKYAATADGLVPWRERPEHFRKNCIARVPPFDPHVPNLTTDS